MEEVKDKMKDLMKKVNKPFSSSSSSNKFKGQGRVLGSGPNTNATPSASSSTAAASATNHPMAPISASSCRPHQPLPPAMGPTTTSTTEGFDPFQSLVSSSSSSRAPFVSGGLQCPVCTRNFPSEGAVAEHLDSCLGVSPTTTEDMVEKVANKMEVINMKAELGDRDLNDVGGFVKSGTGLVAERVSAYVLSEAAKSGADTVVRLLRNIIKEPGNDKFRKIRMGNPKIKAAVRDVEGGFELLECAGFKIKEEDGETWAVMDLPNDEKMVVIKEAVSLLESWIMRSMVTGGFGKLESVSGAGSMDSTTAEAKKMDRKVRVFFPVSEGMAAKVHMPESFYNLSAEEIKRDALQRKKKIEESQLLIPKSFREKQALASRKKYRVTVIRIQFPDGVVLQGLFTPWETTTTLYEFVSSSLKDPSLEFELMQPTMPKLRVVPRFAKAGQQAVTLEDAGLVPSALLRFKPIENESAIFTGLTNELLQASEPMTNLTTTSEQ